MSELLPEGCVSLLDAPFSIVSAIKNTMVFLSWQDNLPKNEMPPKRIWNDGKKLDKHFKAVERNREAEMKGQGNPEEWSGDLKQNEAAKLLIADDD